MGGRKYFLNNGVGMSDKPLPYKHIQDLTHKQLLQVMIDKLCCVASNNLLLDRFAEGVAAAYSLRRLSTTYTGDAIRVRRASDNTEQDIAFVNNELDTSSLTSFCSGTDGFVTTWYDQSGDGNDASQTTAGSQPKIYDSVTGVILENGKPAVNFDGVDDFLLLSGISTSGISSMTHTRVYSTEIAAAADSGGTLYAFGNSSNLSEYFGMSGVTSALSGEYMAWSFNDGIVTTPRLGSTTYRRSADTQVLELENWLSSGFDSYQNNNAITIDLSNNWTTTTNSSPSNFTVNQLGIGALVRSTTVAFQQQKAQEYIFWFNDQSSNRTGIETNINKAFNIYWDGTQKGLLDTYTGAEAAYSLRALNSAYTGAILRVRRDSDNAEQDIYAKWDGTLNVEALESFCSATDGYVTTWYDQSGNGNNATQATAASQPKIVSSGSVITVNGYQVIQYDGTDDNLGTSLTATGTMLMGGSDGTAFYEVSISGGYNLLASASFTDHPLNETLRIIWDRSLSAGEKSAIESLVTYSDWDFSDVTIFSQYWRLRTKLTSFPLLDVSSGTIFIAAWRSCTSLTSFPLLDISSGTNFLEAWRDCPSLTSFPLLDVSSGTNFQAAWLGCSSLTSFPLLDVSSGTNFFLAWSNCSSLTSFPLLDVSSGTNFTAAWFNCTSLTSFPLLDVSSGTGFQSAWNNCPSLTSFPLLDVSSGTTFFLAWYKCTSLTSFPLLDVSSGTNFQEAWYLCSSLTSFPLLDVSSGTNFSSAWRNCSSLTSFPLLDVSSGTNFSTAWRSCTSLTSFPLLDVSSGTNFSTAWENCSSLSSFPLLDVSSGTNFLGAWFACSSLTSFPLLDVSSGTNFYEAWRLCTSLTSFPANMFDSVTATNFTGAFTSTNLTQTSIDNILVSLDTAGQSNGTFNQSGGNAPSATGEAAIDNLRSRGWAVTVTGGY